MNVAEIKAAIQALPKEELTQFNQWYQGYLEEKWGEQIRKEATPFFSRRPLRPAFKKMNEQGKFRPRLQDRDITDLISQDRD